MATPTGLKHSLETSNLADVLERVLDKGVVIAGDIKIKLVDIELLTIQLRLVICSVDKAKEIGMDWWSQDSAFRRLVDKTPDPTELAQRVSLLEAQLAEGSGPEV